MMQCESLFPCVCLYVWSLRQLVTITAYSMQKEGEREREGTGETATLTKRTRRMRVACRRRVANSHLTLPSSREWSRKNATLYRFSLSIFCVFLFGRVEGNFLFGQSNVNGNMNAANVNVSECVCECMYECM